MAPQIVIQAKDYCIKAHEGQYRKFSGEAYSTHPISIAEDILILNGYTNFITQCVAYLHDTIEDTDISRSQLEELFGYKIAHGVNVLSRNTITNFSGLSPEQVYNNRLWHSDEYIQVVKIADVIHNTLDLHLQSPSSAQKKINDITNFYLPMAQRLNSPLEKLLLENINNYYTRIDSDVN